MALTRTQADGLNKPMADDVWAVRNVKAGGAVMGFLAGRAASRKGASEKKETLAVLLLLAVAHVLKVRVWFFEERPRTQDAYSGQYVLVPAPDTAPSPAFPFVS